MGNNTHSPEEIAKKLAQFERLRAEGYRVFEITRRLGITDTTLYAWRQRQQGKPGQAEEMRRLRAENARLRRTVKALMASAGTSRMASRGELVKAPHQE